MKSHTPTIRLGDFCDVYQGINLVRTRADKRSTASLDGVRFVRGIDLFTAAPFSERVAGVEKVNQRSPPERLRLQQGDILFPTISRRLRARIVDGAMEGCFAHHTVTIMRPRPGAPPTSQLANYISSAGFLMAAERSATSTLMGTMRLSPRALAEMRFAVTEVEDFPSDSVVALMDRLIRDIIRVIARNAAELQRVEWRQLEQVVAAAFEKFGFDVQLTPATKDGGKDVILECFERGTRKRYAVEVKHWVSGQAVQGSHLKKFLNVIVNEKHDSGLFLSTSGFAKNAYDAVVQLEHNRLRLGDRDKVISLCQLFVMRESGIWSPDREPSEVFFDHTHGVVM